MSLKVGDILPTSRWGDIKVIDYINSKNVIVEFINTGGVKVTNSSNIYRGAVKDELQPDLVYGVGYNNIKNCIKKGSEYEFEYKLWTRMLWRCYDTTYMKQFPTYANKTVSEDWLVFSNFVEDVRKFVGYDKAKYETWELDKDILVKGNTVYSKSTCCFAPKQLNYLLINPKGNRNSYPIGVHKKRDCKKYSVKMSKDNINVSLGAFDTPEEAFYAYKEAKESYIKEVANRWKDQIDHRVYKALMKYQVEITD